MNPFTGKEYSDNYYKHQEIIENFPAANPDVLKKFDKLRRRQKGLYVKAFEIMRAITDVLKVCN